MGNREAQGRRGASQLHLVKLLRLTHPIGREGLGTQGYEVDGQSSEAQLQDTHVIFAYLRRVVHSNPRGAVHTWCRKDQSQDAGDRVARWGGRGLGKVEGGAGGRCQQK